MKALYGRCLQASLLVVTIVAVAASAAGAVRLLPWLLAREVPLDVCWPFARALAAVAVETAFLMGVPIGFALGAASFVERGEARALMALGASPFGLALRSVAAAAPLAALAFAASVAWGTEASLPGRFAARLVAQGRTSCTRARAPRSVIVPLVDVTWLCFPGSAPRVAGRLPGAGDRAFFTAGALRPSDDLRSLELDDLVLVARGESTESTLGINPEIGSPVERPALRVGVRRAHVAGLAAWGRPASLPPSLRSSLVALTAAALAMIVAWLVILRSVEGRAWAILVGALPALVALKALKALDGTVSRGLPYLLVPLAGLAAALLAAPLVTGARAVVQRFARRHG